MQKLAGRKKEQKQGGAGHDGQVKEPALGG